MVGSAEPATDVEAPPSVGNEGNVGAATEQAATVPEESSAPAAAASNDGVPPTPAPTKVDAYKPRGYRNKQNLLDFAPVLLRILTAVFTLIAFAVIASDSGTSDFFPRFSWNFSNFFYFSYLLTVNVITFVYAVVTILLAVLLLSKSSISNAVFIVIFALDLILSYLLMSASTSAATGVRIIRSDLLCRSSFCSKAYASITFSFLAFFALAAAALISGLRAARLRHSV